MVPEPWSEEYQTQLLEMSHAVFDRIHAVIGEQIWKHETTDDVDH